MVEYMHNFTMSILPLLAMIHVIIHAWGRRASFHVFKDIIMHDCKDIGQLGGLVSFY
jgi:hypothetical protein